MKRLVDAIARSIWLTLLAVVVLSAAAIALATRFGLSTTGASGLYFVVWWTVLFAILPVRIRSQAEAGHVVNGTDPGAPADPALKERAIWTSLVSAVLFVAIAIFAPLQGF